jgi:4-amino-4-deoxy-L-arabinose transferase-like glycosyltransferase
MKERGDGWPVAPWLLGLGFVLFAWFAWASIHKPLTTDETEYSGPALAIVKTGKPLYYTGETPEQYIPDNVKWIWKESPRPMFCYGLAHAPLYVYLLALSLKIFGMTNWAARLPGLLCLLTTLWLLRGILRQILSPEKARGAFAVTAFLFLINPLILQEGLMLDLDNTVVTTLIVLYLHEFLRLEKKATAWLPKYGWLSVLLALLFWAKEFPGFYLSLALLLYVAAQRRWKECLGLLVSLAVGVGLFWGSWCLFAKLNDLPVLYFIRWTTLGILARGEGLFTTIAREAGLTNALFSVVFSFLNTMLWVSPFYLALLVVVLGWRARQFLLTRQVTPLDLALIYVVVMLGVTQVYRPSGWFLKYQYPAHPVLILLLGAFLCEKFEQASPVDWTVGGLLAIALAAIQMQVIHDPVFWFFNGGLKGIGEHQVLLFYGVAAVVLVVAVKLLRWRWTGSQTCAAALAIGLAGANLGLGVKQRQPYVTAISWNNYGETGFAETVNHLKSVLRPNDVPICRKDFGFYLYADTETLLRRWYNPAVLVGVKTADELVRNISAPGVSHIVLDRYSIVREEIPLIQQYYVLDRQIGSFYVLRRVNPRR